MEEKGGISPSGVVTVKGDEALVPRTEFQQNPSFLQFVSPTTVVSPLPPPLPPPPAPAVTVTPGSAGASTGSDPTKKKRGRPRKYAPDGSLNPRAFRPTLSPTPISSSIPLSGDYHHSNWKRGKAQQQHQPLEFIKKSHKFEYESPGSFYEWVGAGLTSVSIKGFKKGTLNLTNSKWSYKLGVQGEHLELFKPGNSGAVKWTVTTKPPKKQPLTWYKVVIDPPSGSEPVGLDMISMGKGMAWLNGEEIGRYWPRIARKNAPNDECVKECDYRGKFMPDKCLIGCGEPWYHVPRSWFKSSGNELVIFEEKGGNPTKIKLSRRKVSVV